MHICIYICICRLQSVSYVIAVIAKCDGDGDGQWQMSMADANGTSMLLYVHKSHAKTHPFRCPLTHLLVSDYTGGSILVPI